MSTADHPRSDGQTKRVNQILEDMLCSYVSKKQSNWEDYLSILEFAYNSSKHSATGFTPFMLTYGFQSRSPMAIDLEKEKIQSIKDFLEDMNDMLKAAHESICSAHGRAKTYANKARQKVTFEKSDFVFLKFPAKLKPMKTGKFDKLSPRYCGPFKILKKIGDATYKLELLKSSQVHPIFHKEINPRIRELPSFSSGKQIQSSGAMAAAATNPGVHFAPADPTLPPPWKGLVDGNTGYIYYWNTETNVTQYEKPLPPQAPPHLVPPLPVGPPPGTMPQAQLQTGSVDSQNGAPGEVNGASSKADPRNSVNSLNQGQGMHGMSNGVSHPGVIVNTHSVNSGAMVQGSMYGSFSHNPPGHPGGGQMTNGPVMGSSAGGGHIPGGAPRAALGMSGGAMHMDSTYAGGGRAPHGSGPGGPQGVMGANMHPSSNRTMQSSSVPRQPKLAVLPVPQRHQVMGGMHLPVQSRQMSHLGNTTAPMSSGPGPFKRSAIDYESEPLKRPRVQGFSEPIPVLDVDTYRRQHEITVVGENVPAPFMTFESANFPPELARELQSAGFQAPTPIQAQSWPLALQNCDIVAIAKTGSGKTLGYLLPAFLHLAHARKNPQLGPVVLVLSPTRELATQIQDEAIKFGKSSRISCTCVYGGAPKGPQLRDLDRGADMVIATPGRLNDFLEMRRVSLRQVSYLVLDEADRMLDMGFEPQIRKIVKEIPRHRQTLMYTATWPKEVRKIAEDLLANAAQVNIGNTDELVANKSITQYVEIVMPYEKQGKLERILRSQEPGSKVIIFCSTKKMCDQLARGLGRGFGAAAIHGDKSQIERDHVLAQFKAGRAPILVATDVAARGLDIKDIRVVINFDFPTGVEDYVHRIGRTGRAGATGIAYSFFTEQDAKHAKELIGVLEGANQKVPMELHDFAAKSFYPKRGGRWEAGPAGGRDGGYAAGFGGSSGGRGGGGGRSEGFGGRGAWGSNAGHFDRRERPIIERFGDREKLGDKSGGRDRYVDDRSRSRDVARRYGSRDRGRSYSRSPSRSWGRSRSRSGSRSPSRSVSRSRSRSRSYDRYSDDRRRWSPYRGRGPQRRKSPSSRSPRRSRSPSSKHGKVTAALNVTAAEERKSPTVVEATILEEANGYSTNEHVSELVVTASPPEGIVEESIQLLDDSNKPVATEPLTIDDTSIATAGQ
ncbi:hypothetical protein L7F22_005245 [Adiantum nelumboides]|nr:hypothetical protein [Adiantum nelumboides]